MPIFKLGCRVTVSAYTEVESDTLEKAIEEAAGRAVVLGGISSGAYPDESWIIEDADGSPENIHDDDA